MKDHIKTNCVLIPKRVAAAGLAVILAMGMGLIGVKVAMAQDSKSLVQVGEVPSEGVLEEYGIEPPTSEENVVELQPLTNEEKLYLSKVLPDTSANAVPVAELKPLLDRAMAEFDQNRYGKIKQMMIADELTTDPEMLIIGSRWLFGVQEEKNGYPIAIRNSKEGADYGRLYAYEDKIREFIRTGKGMEALYDLDGIARVLLPGLEDGSNASKKTLALINKGIKLLQDNAPEGVDIVKWLWDLGLDEYFVCKYNEKVDALYAFVTGYGRVSSNFGKSDADNKKLYKVVATHLVIESYSIAYKKLLMATTYNGDRSMDDRMSETVKYIVSVKNITYLISLGGKENKDLDFMINMASGPAKSESYWNGPEAHKSEALLMLMFPSIDKYGSWVRVKEVPFN
jgi:hypothetical protein